MTQKGPFATTGCHSVASIDMHCGGVESALRSKNPLSLRGRFSIILRLLDDYEMDKLNRMLAILGLDEMIASVENGAAAMLDGGKGGVSGGEKQRLQL